MNGGVAVVEPGQEIVCWVLVKSKVPAQYKAGGRLKVTINDTATQIVLKTVLLMDSFIPKGLNPSIIAPSSSLLIPGLNLT